MARNTAPVDEIDSVEDEDLDFDGEIESSTGSAYCKMDDLVGALLLMKPYKDGTRPSKTAGQADYAWVEAEVWIIEAPEDGWATDFFEGEDVPINLEAFQFTGLQPTTFLKAKMRKNTLGLGVLREGERSSKNRTPPWILDTPTEAQKIKAGKFWKAEKARIAARTAKGDADPWS